VRDVAALDCAKTGELSVFCDGKRTSDFANNHASVVVTNRALSEHAHNGSWLIAGERSATCLREDRSSVLSAACV
jgi:glutathionylspermidine synthase